MFTKYLVMFLLIMFWHVSFAQNSCGIAANVSQESNLPEIDVIRSLVRNKSNSVKLLEYYKSLLGDVNEHKRGVQSYIELANYFLNISAPQYSIVVLNKAEKSYQKNVLLKVLKAVAYEQMECYSSSKLELDEAEKYGGASYELFYYLRGKVNYFLGNMEDAAADFGRQIKKGNVTPDALYWQGRAYKELQRYDDALSSYQNYIVSLKNELGINNVQCDALDIPELSDAYLDAGEIYYLLNREKDAMKNVSLAICFNKYNVKAHYVMSTLLINATSVGTPEIIKAYCHAKKAVKFSRGEESNILDDNKTKITKYAVEHGVSPSDLKNCDER